MIDSGISSKSSMASIFVLAYFLFGLELRHIEASKATPITLQESVVATLLAIVIVVEAFDVNG